MKRITHTTLFQLLTVMILVLVMSCAGRHRTAQINENHDITHLHPIKLLPPQKNIGKPLMQALDKRKTIRKFSDRKISDQDVSNLLWAAFGINRPEKGKGYRTAPSAVNWQMIDIYVAFESGVYLYDANNHMLKPVHSGNILPESTRMMQPSRGSILKAPVTLFYVAALSKTGMMGTVLSEEDKLFYAACDTGFIGQNVYLYCASENLGTVVRGLIDREKLHDLLGLRDDQKAILAQSIGHPEGKAFPDLSKIQDGIYEGRSRVIIEEADGKELAYNVKVIMKDHQIKNIEMVKAGDSEYDTQANAFIDSIVQKQSLDVDAISGATLSCEALLQAIEKALTNSD